MYLDARAQKSRIDDTGSIFRAQLLLGRDGNVIGLENNQFHAWKYPYVLTYQILDNDPAVAYLASVEKPNLLNQGYTPTSPQNFLIQHRGIPYFVDLPQTLGMYITGQDANGQNLTPSQILKQPLIPPR